MAEHGTAIEWTHRPGTKGESWNPLRAHNLRTGGVGHFCEHVTEACRWCYAERLQPRFGNPIRYARQDRAKVETFLDERTLTLPLRWQAPRTIFVCSMTDLFGEWVPDGEIDRSFAVMALSPQHTFIVLTKRPARMRSYCSGLDAPSRVWLVAGKDRDILSALAANGALWGGETPWPLRNVWLGTSVHDQASADRFVPELLATPAALRFVSAEPLLGPIDFGVIVRNALFDGVICQDGKTHPLGWFIAGGESGPKARPMHPDWPRRIRDDCAAAGVPFFFKQWGGWTPGVNVERQTGSVETATWFDTQWSIGRENLASTDGHVDDEPDLYKVGKKAAGRQLDGREHSEWPEAQHA